MVLSQKTFAGLFVQMMTELGLTRAQVAEIGGLSLSTVDRYRDAGYSQGPPSPSKRRKLERDFGLPKNYFEGSAPADWGALKAKRQPATYPTKVGSQSARMIVREALANYERHGVYEVSVEQVKAWLKLLGGDESTGEAEGGDAGGKRGSAG